MNAAGLSADNDTIIGSSANDAIMGGGGKDSLSGGSGDDVIGFSGGGFDTVQHDNGSGSLDLDDTDLLIAGQPLNTAAEVRAYVNSNSTSTAHGLFLLATSDSGSRVLYYTDNASATGANTAFFQIAELGAGSAPQLSDFVFV